MILHSHKQQLAVTKNQLIQFGESCRLPTTETFGDYMWERLHQ